MTQPIIEVENLSKQYRLGEVSTGTVAQDINRWWARLRGKEDPFLKVTHRNDRSQNAKGGSEFVWALDNVNFNVARGEMLGIIGRNGAGKSTLLKILSRVTAPTTGEIRVGGRIASLLEVGTGFHPELTGRENIFLNGAILGMNKAEIRSKLDEIVEFSGCALYLDTPVKRFSSGMIVRLGFAVAAHLEPEILIVDEVLAVGDAEFQKRCVGKMQDVASHGRTVLFVSHNMSLIESLCSRTISIKQGRVDRDGDTVQVIQDYIREGGGEHDFGSVERFPRTLGDGRVWIEKIELLNHAGIAGATVGVGEPCAFALEIRAWERLRDPRLSLGIDDQMGRRILTLASDQDPDFRCDLGDEKLGRFVCQIPEMVLIPDRYQVSVALVNRSEVVDAMDHVCGFDVVGRDFFGTGRELRPNQGTFLGRSTWSQT